MSVDARANPLLAELQGVHARLREELATCDELAAAAAAGATPDHLRARLDGLATGSPLFQLKVNCLRYCATVHSHHGGEDVALFPAVRRSAPHLVAVVDRLEADHRVVSELLGRLESVARELDEDDDGTVRADLVDALTALSGHLLPHLDLEEEALGPVLATWPAWPER